MRAYIPAIILLAVLAKATPPGWNPSFPNLGISNTGAPVYGRYTFLTGLRFNTSNPSAKTTATFKECLDLMANVADANMVTWDPAVGGKCIAPYTSPNIFEGKESYSRIVIRLGTHETNKELKYFPAMRGNNIKLQPSYAKREVEGKKRFDAFMRRCDVGHEHWVEVDDNKWQWGWSCYSYDRSATGVLAFRT